MLKPARIIEPLLRRAMAFYRIEKNRDSCNADFIFQILGRGTEALSRLRVGEEVEFLGPLGKSFQLEPAEERGAALIVAGGVGTPAVLMLCEQLRDRNIQTRIFIGARSSDDLIGVDDFSALGLPLIISTDDGSAGEKGFVTQPFERFLNSTIEKNFIVYTCGPEPMMKRMGVPFVERKLAASTKLEATYQQSGDVLTVTSRAPGFSRVETFHLTRNMVELRVTLAVEIAREFGCEDPSYAAIGMS